MTYDTSEGREALATRHQDRVDLHAPQPTMVTAYVRYEPSAGWFATLTDSRTDRVLLSTHGPSAHDVMREVALAADKATVR